VFLPNLHLISIKNQDTSVQFYIKNVDSQLNRALPIFQINSSLRVNIFSMRTSTPTFASLPQKLFRVNLTKLCYLDNRVGKDI